jgi:hypothetical protein
MEGARRYEIASGYRWLMLGISYLCLIGLVAGAAGVLGSGEAETDDVVALALCGILFGGMALYGLWVGHRPAHYAVEMVSEGIILPATGRMIPWSSIARFRERPVLQRVDLIDHSGETVARLEYQLARFEEALRLALDSCPGLLSHASLPGSPETPGAASFLVTSESVVLRDGASERQVPLSEVAAVRFALVSLGQGNRGLRLYLSLTDGSAVALPEGVAPFPAYGTIRDALKRVRAGAR